MKRESKKIEDACFVYMQLNSAITNIRNIASNSFSPPDENEFRFNDSMKKLKHAIGGVFDCLPEMSKINPVGPSEALLWCYDFTDDIKETYEMLMKQFYDELVNNISEAISNEDLLKKIVRYWIYYHFFRKVGFYGEDAIKWEDLLYRVENAIDSEIENVSNDDFYFLNVRRTNNLVTNSYIREVILELLYRHGLASRHDNAILMFYNKVLEFDLGVKLWEKQRLKEEKVLSIDAT